MKFCDRLMELRKGRGMTQEQLGAVAGVSRQTVSKWELGETTPELEKLYLLCDYFQISMDELTGRTGGSDREPDPPARSWGWHYEYRSERTLWGLPLVHINLGRGFPPRRAKGIVAIGDIAQGLVAVGGLATGLVSAGGAAVGLLSLGGLSLGLLLALGGISVGGCAVGGIAVGWFAAGGLAVGRYALGGCALASRIAAGGYAQAPVAIGDKMSGGIQFSVHRPVPRTEFCAAVRERFPHIWRPLIDLFYACFEH